MRIALSALLLCFASVLWADKSTNEFNQEILGNLLTGGDSVIPSPPNPSDQSSTGTIENPGCNNIRSLPMNFFSDYVPDGNFEMNLEDDDKVTFPPIRLANCFVPNSSEANPPITIGLERLSLKGYYVITARVNPNITTQDELRSQLIACGNKHKDSLNTPSTISLPIENPNETKSVIWGVAGNRLGLNASGSIGDFIDDKDGNDSCFSLQEVSGAKPNLVYAPEHKGFQLFLGPCTECNSTLAEIIKQDPGYEGTVNALWRLSMNQFEDGLKEYANRVRRGDESDEMREREELYFDRLEEFLLEYEVDGKKGLVGHYHDLVQKLNDMDNRDGLYASLQAEKNAIQSFLANIGRSFLGEKGRRGVADYLKVARHYERAKEAAFLGHVGQIVSNKANEERSLTSIMGDVRAKRREWNQELRSYKATRRAYDNPRGGYANAAESRYGEAAQLQQDRWTQLRAWERETAHSISNICTNTKSWGRLPTFTSSATRQVDENCRFAQRDAELDYYNRSYEMRRDKQRLFALENEAKEIALAERAGFERLRRRGEFYFDDGGFAHSDELHSPHADAYKYFQRRGSPHGIVPPRILHREFDYDPELPMHYAGFRFDGGLSGGHLGPPPIYPSSLSGPRSFVVPPDYDNLGHWGIPSRQYRSIGGRYSSPMELH